LLVWGRGHFRPFPWRSDRDPYRVLVTEVLLKQTRADRVHLVRAELLVAYPTATVLATADRRDLANLISTLGFGRQRTDQLLSLARVLKDRSIPRQPALLQTLPGVGPYSAAATACFAYGRRYIALDVNVARILGRVFGITLKSGEPRKSALIRSIGQQVIDGAQPRRVNWALLDLGATVCRPRPRCHECPLQERCWHAKT
jgi:A/G-specific adenine glycosylase